MSVNELTCGYNGAIAGEDTYNGSYGHRVCPTWHCRRLVVDLTLSLEYCFLCSSDDIGFLALEPVLMGETSGSLSSTPPGPSNSNLLRVIIRTLICKHDTSPSTSPAYLIIVHPTLSQCCLILTSPPDLHPKHHAMPSDVCAPQQLNNDLLVQSHLPLPPSHMPHCTVSRCGNIGTFCLTHQL